MKTMVKYMRLFLWDSSDRATMFPLVSWSHICQPHDKGGLGIRLLKSMNKALLSRWMWRFALERNACWRVVVAAMYGVREADWCSNIRW